MKRFLLFRYDTYYPTGGCNDFYGHYATREEAQKDIMADSNYDHWDLLDTETGLVESDGEKATPITPKH